MWEYSITLPKTKYNLLNKLMGELTPLIKDVSGVITTMYSRNDVTILIACKQEYMLRIKPKIIELICNLIILDYKYNYLINNFKFKVTDDINMQAFIKALVIFDSELDKEIIRQKLKDFDSVNIESFYNFRLKLLKTKWQDLVSLANDNFVYLMKSETFIELLKFIIAILTIEQRKLT